MRLVILILVNANVVLQDSPLYSVSLKSNQLLHVRAKYFSSKMINAASPYS